MRCTPLRAKFSASARRRPSATISSRPPSAALSARRSTSCSSPWTTRRACSGSSRRDSWILWSWRAFSTSAVMTASCCREEPYIGICAAGHRFAGRRVSPEELLSETLLLREPGSGTRNILERELTQVSYSTAAFSRTICISSFPVIRALTAANCGISFLYEAVVRGSPEIGSFTCPPLTGRHELNVVFLQHTGRRQPRPRIRRASHGAVPLTGRQKYRATSERSVQTGSIAPVGASAPTH